MAHNDKIISAPNLDFTPNPGGLGCTLYEKMQEHQDKIAQINAVTGEEETFKVFLKRCIRTAITMRSKGIAQDDLVTISGGASMDICVPYVATLLLGAKPVSLDINYSVDDLIYMLKIIKSKIIFAGPEVVEKMEKATKDLPGGVEIVVFGNTSTHTPFVDFLQPQAGEDVFQPVPATNLKDTAAILFSSGTTGPPKGVRLSHYGLIVNNHHIGSYLRYSTALTFASLSWISTVDIVIAGMQFGNTRIVIPGFDPSKFWNILETYKPTLLFLAPIFVVILNKFRRPEHIKSLALKMVVISGGVVPEKHLKYFKSMIPEATVMMVYAQTELIGPMSFFKPNIPGEMAMLKTKPSSVGTVLPGFSFKVVDIKTEALLGPNEKGEIRIKSDVAMTGYCNRDASDVWDADGYMKTGDIGYYDEDKCFYVLDRIKEILKVGESEVIPALVEAVIVQHPAVDAAIVIGIPHETDGYHLMGIVVLCPGVKDVSPNDIQKFVDEKVEDAQKLTAGIKIVDKVPMSSTGKIRKTDIRNRILNGEL